MTKVYSRSKISLSSVCEEHYSTRTLKLEEYQDIYYKNEVRRSCLCQRNAIESTRTSMRIWVENDWIQDVTADDDGKRHDDAPYCVRNFHSIGVMGSIREIIPPRTSNEQKRATRERTRIFGTSRKKLDRSTSFCVASK
jgi:hypothetical protein